MSNTSCSSICFDKQTESYYFMITHPLVSSCLRSYYFVDHKGRTEVVNKCFLGSTTVVSCPIPIIMVDFIMGRLDYY